MPSKADLLADLLDGELDPADVPAELAELAQLAGSVREHIVLVPPTPAFRASLREELLESVGTQAATGAAATTIGSNLPGIVAGVAATAVLAASSVVASTPSAAPGDLAYDAKRTIESVQLLVADDARDVDLLAEFANERVREAIGLADIGLVNDLLAESERLLDDALALAVAQGRDVTALVERHAAVLRTLASRHDDPVVRAHIDQRLDDLGLAPLAPVPGPAVPGDGTSGDGTSGDDPVDEDDPVDPGDEPAQDDATEEPGDDPSDSLDDPLDDPLDELDDPLDELDPLDDPLDDPVGDLVDELDDAVDDTSDLLGD